MCKSIHFFCYITWKIKGELFVVRCEQCETLLVPCESILKKGKQSHNGWTVLFVGWPVEHGLFLQGKELVIKSTKPNKKELNHASEEHRSESRCIH
jgi:hypothetical protein